LPANGGFARTHGADKDNIAQHSILKVHLLLPLCGLFVEHTNKKTGPSGPVFLFVLDKKTTQW